MELCATRRQHSNFPHTNRSNKMQFVCRICNAPPLNDTVKVFHRGIANMLSILCTLLEYSTANPFPLRRQRKTHVVCIAKASVCFRVILGPRDCRRCTHAYTRKHKHIHAPLPSSSSSEFDIGCGGVAERFCVINYPRRCDAGCVRTRRCCMAFDVANLHT